MPVHLHHIFIDSAQLISRPIILCELLQIPDVSAVVQASDFPCIKAAQDTPDTDFRADWQQLPPEHFDGRPIPVFGYNRREGFMDLLFPDFTYFGHEYSQITGAELKMRFRFYDLPGKGGRVSKCGASPPAHMPQLVCCLCISVAARFHFPLPPSASTFRGSSAQRASCSWQQRGRQTHAEPAPCWFTPASIPAASDQGSTTAGLHPSPDEPHAWV